jgi:nitronate monooxygenase
MKTRLTELLGIRHPILLAPMGTVSGGALASAVSQAGGLGLIGGGYGDANWIRRELLLAGNSRIGCGFISWSLATKPDLLDLVLEHQPAAVMLSFGDLAPFAPKIKAAGAALICQVQTLDLARQAIDAGADVLVAQGTEAGGHGLARSTFTLVPEIADLLARTSPGTVLAAAGGVADGRGLAAALMLGAEGVLVGTRFWASTEALVPQRFQAEAVASDGDNTLRTTVVDIARKIDFPPPFTARVLKTEFALEWHGREADLAEPDTQSRQQARYWEGYREGDPTNTCLLVGEAVGLIGDIQPAGAIVEAMVRDAETLLQRGSALAG